MKSVTLSLITATGCGLIQAQEVGRVLSSTPVVQQVQVPRQVCSQETVQAPAQKSGAGAAMGAVAGGALGNAIGHGSGRAAATMLGIFGGAVLGDRIEGTSAGPAQSVQRCTTQTFLENRVTGYQVVYEFAGKQYSVQLPQDPGPQVQLQITPVGVAPPPVTYSAPVASPPVVVTQPVYISSASHWYPAYYPYAYRPPVAVNLDFGYVGGGHHRHWR